MQRSIAQTIVERVVENGRPIVTERDADLLADHIADDLCRLAPLVPPEHWLRDNGA